MGILILKINYLVPQCAALSTQFSLRRVPPQNMLANDVDEDLERPTCHPTSPLMAFWPPTTLVKEFLLRLRDRSLSRVFLPQVHLEQKLELTVSWLSEAKKVGAMDQD